MLPLAVSTAVQIVYAIAFFSLVFGPLVVAEMKGQWGLAAMGWYTLGITYWIGAFRLATPDSWWARHLYGPAKLARAEARYGGPEST